MKKFLLQVIFVLLIVPTVPLVILSVAVSTVSELIDKLFRSSLPSKVVNTLLSPVHVLAVILAWLVFKDAENYPTDTLHKLLRKANLQ